ncbi:hypothetical protein GCM10010400_59490 [Streptomyces aculeolatus]
MRAGYAPAARAGPAPVSYRQRVEGSWAMALTRSKRGGPLPERAAPRRGARAVAAFLPRTLPTGPPRAVVAAAGCAPAQPFPGSGIGRHVGSPGAPVVGHRARRAHPTRAGRGGRP